jgi:diguanylate cyclase (GGDEF)-like protein
VQDGIRGHFCSSGNRHGSFLIDSKKTLWLRLKRHFAESFAEGLLLQQRGQDDGFVDESRDKRRRGAYRYIFLLLTVVLLPLVANNIYLNQPLPIIAALVLLLAILVLNILLISLNRDPFLSPPIVVGISIALAILSLYLGQNYSLYLLFPLLVALPILLKTRDAIILGVVAGLVTAPAVLAGHNLTTAAAIGVSMGLTWLVSAWLVFAMNEQSRRLKDLAITDSLTGAFNRRYLELQAARCLQDWERHQRSVSLLLLDIDNFKKINDEFGHSVGDAALKSLVCLVKERIRGVDTLCRYGGEEFVLLLSETTAVQAKIVANQLRRAVEQAEVLPWGSMTISIGVCDVRQAPDLEIWFKRADAALYAAKDLGRNRVELAEPLDIPAPGSERAHWRTYASRR